MLAGRLPCARSAATAGDSPALSARSWWPIHSVCELHCRAVIRIANSLSRAGMELLKRRYSPTRCVRSISSGLRNSTAFGPYGFSLPRGPPASSRAALSCASVISLSGSDLNLGACACAGAGGSANRQPAAMESSFIIFPPLETRHVRREPYCLLLTAYRLFELSVHEAQPLGERFQQRQAEIGLGLDEDVEFLGVDGKKRGMVCGDQGRKRRRLIEGGAFPDDAARPQPLHGPVLYRPLDVPFQHDVQERPRLAFHHDYLVLRR